MVGADGPFAASLPSFRRQPSDQVKWPGGLRLFEVTRDRDRSLTLCRWHKAQVRLMGNGASEATLALVKAHCVRSRGDLNLMPSQEHNPIVLG